VVSARCIVSQLFSDDDMIGDSKDSRNRIRLSIRNLLIHFIYGGSVQLNSAVLHHDPDRSLWIHCVLLQTRVPINGTCQIDSKLIVED
jgi:hypothetical protein